MEDNMLLNEDDDEILANFPMEDDNGYDSTDDILTKLMEKENASSPPKKKRKSSCIKNEEDDQLENKGLNSDVDEESDDEASAEIAALQAQIEKLKAAKKLKKTPKKKANCVENNNAIPSTNLCSHNKEQSSCFFCSSKNEDLPSTSNDKCEDLRSDKKERDKNKPNDNELYKNEPVKNKQNYLKDKFFSKISPSKEKSKVCEDFVPTQKKLRVAHEQKKTDNYEEKCDMTKRTKVSNDSVTTSGQKVKTKQDGISPVIKRKSAEMKNQSNSSSSSHVYTYGGIAISHPKLSSSVLESRLSGRKIIHISKIQSKLKNNDIEGDWLTIGVLVKKVAQKKTANGKNFSVWQLSDLGVGTENQTVGFFLFGDTYKEHWKIQVGTVIGLLNPTIMKQEKSTYQELSISLDNPKKLMEIGLAKELGVCKGIRKNDGKSCSMFVNTSYGEYCEYHILKAFKKASASRMELQSGGPGAGQKPKGSRMRMLRKDIDAGDVFYGGQTVTLGKDHKKNNVKLSGGNNMNCGGLQSVMGSELKSLAAKEFEENKLRIKKEKAEEQKALHGGSEEFKQLLITPTVGSRNLMHLLHGNQVKEEEEKAPKKSHMGAKDFLKHNKKELLQDISSEDNKQHKKRKFSDINFFENNKQPDKNQSKDCNIKRKSHEPKQIPTLPKLGRGFGRSSVIEFSDNEEDCLSYNNYTGEETERTVTTLKSNNDILISEQQKKQNVQKFSYSSVKAKRKAISIIQQQGIQPEDPNEIPGRKKVVKNVMEIENRVEKDLNTDITNGEEKPKKREGTLKGVLGSLDVNSKEGKKILNQTSRNVGAVRLAENEQEEKYFNSMVKKEAMEEKMTRVHEIKVTCYSCTICNYLAQSQSQFCREEKHSVTKVKQCTKRFFKCKSCKTRCETFNAILPKENCRRCGDSNFVKTSMVEERKGPKIGRETLELRGREQKYLNSLF